MIESLPSPYILFEGMGVVDLPILTKYIESGVNLFCILNSNEIEERRKLKALGNIKILQHPFSANQYQDFFKLQSGVESDEVLLEHTPIPMEKIISGHVLLVEDNQINQLVAGDMLEALGITYELAEDGLQAVDAVKNNHYDLVLMDVQMPKMDGYTATRVLREAGLNDVIICGLSANALKEDEERAEQSGMNDYLTKPLMQDKLRLMLEKYLS
jgi:CheY-like chemotaxis protein